MLSEKSELIVRAARPDDTIQIADIYNHYVLTSTITFEEEPVSVTEMEARVRELQAASYPWLVATVGTDVLGYAYGGKWKTRAAYRHSSEITVYVRAGLAKSGVGTALYAQLLPTLKSIGVHAAIGGVALPNEASIRHHEKFGSRKCARFSERAPALVWVTPQVQALIELYSRRSAPRRINLPAAVYSARASGATNAGGASDNVPQRLQTADRTRGEVSADQNDDFRKLEGIQ